ncbi:MAG: toll/interleukin-1 receptor domain-containing protein [Oscillospiraceae bacterium]|jgi:tetratricopeptide (TPR) repeat protein|nr:toll/interleukin-1 receptor domain-containing protein [Oscillospiraceae bacterium]
MLPENKKPFVFICHSHDDNDKQFTEFIEQLKENLENKDIECFIDHISLKGGQYFEDEIIDSLSKATIILVIENENMKHSNFCHLERGFAFAKGIREIPYSYGTKTYKTNLVSIKGTQSFPYNPAFPKGFNQLLKIIDEEFEKKAVEKINKSTEKNEKELLLEIKELLDQKLIYKPIDAASGSISTFDDKITDNQPKENTDEEKIKESLSLNIKLKIAEEQFDKAKYSVAEELFKDLAESYGENSEEKAYVLYKLGDVYNELAKYNDALEYYENSLTIRESIFGMESTETATVYNNMGVVYNALADYKTALEFYNKSLKIQEKLLEEDDPEIARVYNNMGYTYTLMAEYDKAFEYLNNGLEIRLKKLGENHKDTAVSYNNIGNVYYYKDEYDKAVEYHEKALKIREKVLSKDHPLIAFLYNNIGNVYYRKSEYDKALEYHEKALAIYEKVLGKGHPYTAMSYNNIGSVYYDRGDYEKALEYHEKSLKIREKVLGEEHPDTATSYNNIGAVYYHKCEYDKALKYCFKDLAICEKFLGTEHPDTKNTYDNIAFIYRALDDTENEKKFSQLSMV